MLGGTPVLYQTTTRDPKTGLMHNHDHLGYIPPDAEGIRRIREGQNIMAEGWRNMTGVQCCAFAGGVLTVIGIYLAGTGSDSSDDTKTLVGSLMSVGFGICTSVFCLLACKESPSCRC